MGDVAICRVEYPIVTGVLDCFIHVCPAFDPRVATTTPEHRQYRGIFDTGSDRSVISPRVVTELGLKAIGQTNRTYMDVCRVDNLFLVNFALSPVMGFGNIQAVGCDMSEGLDCLIGMDVISRGDFFLTHAEGRTVLLFRVPALGFQNLESIAEFNRKGGQ